MASAGVALWCLTTPACVERLVKIDTEPAGVAVLVNGRSAGTTPLEFPFVYYGSYRVDVWKEGYEPWSGVLDVSPPWYQYFPFDLIAENLDPFTHWDVHQHTIQMEPLSAPGSLAEPERSAEDLLREAEELRAQVR